MALKKFVPKKEIIGFLNKITRYGLTSEVKNNLRKKGFSFDARGWSKEKLRQAEQHLKEGDDLKLGMGDLGLKKEENTYFRKNLSATSSKQTSVSKDEILRLSGTFQGRKKLSKIAKQTSSRDLAHNILRILEKKTPAGHLTAEQLWQLNPAELEEKLSQLENSSGSSKDEIENVRKILNTKRNRIIAEGNVSENQKTKSGRDVIEEILHGDDNHKPDDRQQNKPLPPLFDERKLPGSGMFD
ncbi:hypothetical protein C4569_00280 [Candidatus Parcubacteria bacterium]|nr:MAG: hypothetical protein C4569_00280 [Candidatus Parcubacteria bacterium]